jgi:hypothetical protein
LSTYAKRPALATPAGSTAKRSTRQLDHTPGVYQSDRRPVRVIGTRRNNAELMADCHRLGYLPEAVLDVTYERGRFWKQHRPAELVACDIDPDCGVIVADFTALPFPDSSFATVVLDPPYKLNGTSTGRGPSAADARYGVGGSYRSVAVKHRLIQDGIIECARVTSRFLLVKCEDQVCNGVKHWQARIFANTAERVGLRLRDMLHVAGYRKQPEGRNQEHAHSDYSTLLVFEVSQ